MARPRRIHVHGGIYHAMLRGNHRNAIFHTPGDREEFEDILGQAVERFGSRVLAYCWMTNHVHLIVQVADHPLGRIVQILSSRYARQYQRRVPTTGHLFERRYRARLITDVGYLLQAVRYIHLNPVIAGMVMDPANYPWSSHRHFLGAPAPEWLSVHQVLARFGGSGHEAMAAYVAYVGAPRTECPVSRWVNRAPHKSTEGAAAPESTRLRPAPGLEALLTEIAGRHGVSPAELRSQSRKRSLSLPRAALAHAALNSGTATLTEISAFLGRAPSTLSWLLQRYGSTLDPSQR